MKLKVKSQADLKRVALASGAELDYRGSKFNTTHERAQVAAPPAPEPAPEVAAPPAPPAAVAPATSSVTEQISVNLDMAPVAEAVAKSNERLTEVITESLRQLSVPTVSSHPNKWVFIIKRDSRGFIESVEASPSA